MAFGTAANQTVVLFGWLSNLGEKKIDKRQATIVGFIEH